MLSSREYKQILSCFIDDEVEVEFLDEFRLLWKQLNSEIQDLRNYPHKNTALAVDIRTSMLEICKENNFDSYFIVEPIYELVRRTAVMAKFVNKEGFDISKLIMF